jgi:hypothetical protein
VLWNKQHPLWKYQMLLFNEQKLDRLRDLHRQRLAVIVFGFVSFFCMQ